jgi:hypothetical protein
MLLLLPVALLVAAFGGMLIAAARQVEADRPDSDVTDGVLPGGRLAVRMRNGLERTAQSVDVLVERRPREELVRAKELDPELRRTTGIVLGLGLIGLAGVMVLGLVLLQMG